VKLEPRLFDLSAKNRQLAPEDENPQLSRPLTTPEQHDQLQQAVDSNVHGCRPTPRRRRSRGAFLANARGIATVSQLDDDRLPVPAAHIEAIGAAYAAVPRETI
jgi:hypothetical protein